jgi:hypothetical protein
MQPISGRLWHLDWVIGWRSCG